MSDEQSSIPAIEYREVPGFTGLYRAGSDGSVWSRQKGNSKHAYPWHRLSPGRDLQGYQQLTLYKDGISLTRKVHRIIAMAFIGPKPDGLQTRHLNGFKEDNRPENLAYGTGSDNRRDLGRHIKDRVTDYPSAKMTRAMVKEGRHRVAQGESIHVVANDFGVLVSTLHLAVIGKTWKWLPDAVPMQRGDGEGFPIGESHPMTTLTDEEVVMLRNCARQGMPYRKLAAKFGVSLATARRIAVGITWKHLPGALGMEKRVKAILEEK